MDLVYGFILGIVVGVGICMTTESSRHATPALSRYNDPSRPPPITDCIGLQWAAVRDDGKGPWMHDCVGSTWE